MSSAYSPIWKRFLYKAVPFLWKRCPEGNYHWRWDRLCFCRLGEHCGDWHGGVYDLKTGKEYQLCDQCLTVRPEHHRELIAIASGDEALDKT